MQWLIAWLHFYWNEMSFSKHLPNCYSIGTHCTFQKYFQDRNSNSSWNMQCPQQDYAAKKNEGWLIKSYLYMDEKISNKVTPLILFAKKRLKWITSKWPRYFSTFLNTPPHPFSHWRCLQRQWLNAQGDWEYKVIKYTQVEQVNSKTYTFSPLLYRWGAKPLFKQVIVLLTWPPPGWGKLQKSHTELPSFKVYKTQNM